MTMKVALEYLPKETIDEYAGIGCIVFGDILLQAMGINGSCSSFKKSKKYPDSYLISWVLDSGEEYMDRFEYSVLKRALTGKSLCVTTSVYKLD